MEYGEHKKYEIGYIKVDKKIYMPTVERLDKWVDIISKKNGIIILNFILQVLLQVT